ncbi:hypothetical protein VUR80DRAFT_3375 [Thermomyces stellatus]
MGTSRVYVNARARRGHQTDGNDWAPHLSRFERSQDQAGHQRKRERAGRIGYIGGVWVANSAIDPAAGTNEPQGNNGAFLNWQTGTGGVRPKAIRPPDMMGTLYNVNNNSVYSSSPYRTVDLEESNWAYRRQILEEGGFRRTTKGKDKISPCHRHRATHQHLSPASDTQRQWDTEAGGNWETDANNEGTLRGGWTRRRHLRLLTSGATWSAARVRKNGDSVARTGDSSPPYPFWIRVPSPSRCSRKKRRVLEGRGVQVYGSTWNSERLAELLHLSPSTFSAHVEGSSLEEKRRTW